MGQAGESAETGRVKGDGNVGSPAVVFHKCRGSWATFRGRIFACHEESARKMRFLPEKPTYFATPQAEHQETTGAARTVGGLQASKRVRSERMARRPNAAVGVVCPRCGMLAARIIGRSESLPVIYLQCEDCGRTSVAPSGEQA